MTYRSRGRSIFEVIVAVCFVGFLVGFITVLCIGNYFRAKRAQERQKQRRLSKMAQQNNNNQGRSPSQGGYDHSVAGDSTVSGYEAPRIPNTAVRNGISA
mmetsp:Transcript_10837/g.20272  ORF Transcript_10837/g.20272 Transcript_10837/m.20272 type:complete len:100 (-) Transcript_10837:382-681(-)|eukprot:CAMPEP_0176498126 /NCGR_PEP_ID=MMETSP0200_2-20121128/12133_1 /TAXON_ID=947934 /ORGANISM="Chaetoceros sp., Strain GSL56" /LENGTH=99 /DNA_ID=CAMNT_0017896269 /DNA_START=105 /DNA_END=404 /DNA_ORIENTATION=+